MSIFKIKWIDSCSGDGAWHTIDNDYKHGITKPTSVGFKIYEDDEKIVLAQTYAEENADIPAQYNGTITIPKCSIIEIKIMKEQQ